MTGNPNKVLIPSVRYDIWGWPAVVNLIFGGTAAGFYLFGLLDTALFRQVGDTLLLLRYNLVSALLVAAGFLTVGMEAGRPSRGKFLLHHLKRSWMSREVLAGLVFILSALADWMHPSATFKTIATVSAVGLLVCQGFMVFSAPAVVAWSRIVIPLHFVISGLAMGFGCYLFWSAAITRTMISAQLLLPGLICLIAGSVVWYLIVRPKADPIEDCAVMHLRDPLSMMLTIGFGHVVPILLALAVAALVGLGFAADAVRLLSLFAGICVLPGGMIQKTGLILQANALRATNAGSPRYNKPACPRP